MNRTSKLLFSLLLLASGPLWADAPSDPENWNTNYEADPASGDSVAQGDDHMRQMKVENRRRFEVEHQVGGSLGTGDDAGDNGLHRQGSARVFIESSEPTILDASAEAHDNTNPTNGSGTLADAETNNPAATPPSIGHGRLYVDGESYSAQVYDDIDPATAALGYGWKAIAAPATNTRNRVENGGFERNGYILIGAATCADTNDTPARDDDPTATNVNQTSGSADGFCDNHVGDYLYYVGPGVEGWDVRGTPTSFVLEATDDEAGFGYEFKVASNSAGDGIQQTLTNLEANTEYRVTASVLAGSGSTCEIDVTDELSTAGTTDLPVNTTSTSYTVLTGFFTTDTTPTDVVLELDETAGTGQCSWDNVVVQRVDPNQAQPNMDWAYEMIDVTSAQQPEALTTDLLTWAGGSCYWRISFAISSDASGFTQGVDVAFDEDADGASGSATGWTRLRSFADTGANTVSASGTFLAFKKTLNDAAAAGSDTGDAVVDGDDLRFRVHDGNFGDNIECDNNAECSFYVEQICSSI